LQLLAMTTSPSRHDISRGASWASWILGAALLAGVIAASLHLAEARAFVRLLERTNPSWILVAGLLQLATYAAQGSVWRRVAGAAGHRVSRRTAFELGLAKLFADQALPSAGLSSSILIARSLERRRVPPAAVKAAVLIDLASYHGAYGLALIAALAILVSHREANAVIVISGVLVLFFSTTLSATVVALAGKRYDGPARALRCVPGAGTALEFLAGADARLVSAPRVLVGTVALHLAIVALDAVTMWTLARAFGAHVPPGGVFAGFMVASLFRTMGVVPGGLGTFEATSVLMLRLAGLDLAGALSATLLFRGLTFWLPMLPGYWASRRVLADDGTQASSLASPAYWSIDPRTLAHALASGPNGLTTADAIARLARHGPNRIRERRDVTRLDVLWRQLRSPLLLLLVFAALAAVATGEWLDAAIVLVIVFATVAIGYSREYRAQAAAASLRARLRVQARVLRDGQPIHVPLEDIVPGDVVRLSAGSLVPADAVVIEAADFFVNEAVLTGESFPVQKAPGPVAASADVAERTNCVFMGTNARSGTAQCLVVATGSATEFGTVARRLMLRPPDTEFERGIRRFGYLLMSAMLVMVLLVFVVHMFRDRPPVETLLFAVALAVGLSPELLPAILSVNLARGAQALARRGVLVRRLNAIENLGSMTVLCTDKTGTLTEGVVRLEGAYDPSGQPSSHVLTLGAWNAALETGVASPLDDAIAHACQPDLTGVSKQGEIPFDFVRKRVTVVVATARGVQFVTKGAVPQVLGVCVHAAGAGRLNAAERETIERQYEAWTGRGIRVLAVASRLVEARPSYGRDDEREMTFEGFLTFLDRPKEGVGEAIADLASLGVAVKVISGDSRLVVHHIADLIGLRTDRVLTGRQLDELHDEALWRAAEQTDLFVEVDPNQKERIILSLKKTGHVVGFLGDGINDAPAMHAADTSLSVDQAVDVAREAADFVLLERGLDVIRRGIDEGRRTFANTLKYVLITTSANLGNMASMAAASLVLPFLPLTAGQILLNNFLSDIPAIGIADDRVDPELVAQPRRWDIRFIGHYMAAFGLLSSVFDLLTFGALIAVFHATPELFRTGWFVESLLTELVVALTMRTRRPFFRSRPGRVLLLSTMALIPLAVAIPYLPVAAVLGFVPMPGLLAGTVGAVTLAYVAATEAQKTWFYRR
jgi:Mg2+-importing ATPase